MIDRLSRYLAEGNFDEIHFKLENKHSEVIKKINIREYEIVENDKIIIFKLDYGSHEILQLIVVAKISAVRFKIFNN